MTRGASSTRRHDLILGMAARTGAPTLRSISSGLLIRSSKRSRTNAIRMPTISPATNPSTASLTLFGLTGFPGVAAWPTIWAAFWLIDAPASMSDSRCCRTPERASSPSRRPWSTPRVDGFVVFAIWLSRSAT